MAENEMTAWSCLPERVRSMEGLAVVDSRSKCNACAKKKEESWRY
jgi:hypothetical protein